ncbi:MAG: S41 family peptidase [Bacteroidota bacterium]
MAIIASGASFSQSCNCDAAFKWATKAFEQNDAGYQYIIDQKGRESYNGHNITFEKKVSKITNPDSCVQAMLQWAKFFRVGHFGFIVNQTVPDQGNKSGKKNASTGASVNSYKSNSPYVREYDSNTVYLRIPTFDSRYKKAIDSVILMNSNLILSKKNLIIDIVNNGGGDDKSFAEIIPYLYTNPIRDVSVARLSTPHNNKFWQEYMSQSGISSSDKAIYAGYLKKLNENPGKFVVLNDSVYTTRLQKVLPFPQNVGILINEKNGSTAEQFLLAARQSKKVKLFGTTTMGELDISNMYNITSPDGKFTMWYCMSKSLRIPENTIDNKGISPDYFLDKSIPQTKWLSQVAEIISHW